MFPLSLSPFLVLFLFLPLSSSFILFHSRICLFLFFPLFFSFFLFNFLFSLYLSYIFSLLFSLFLICIIFSHFSLFFFFFLILTPALSRFLSTVLSNRSAFNLVIIFSNHYEPIQNEIARKINLNLLTEAIENKLNGVRTCQSQGPITSPFGEMFFLQQGLTPLFNLFSYYCFGRFLKM